MASAMLSSKSVCRPAAFGVAPVRPALLAVPMRSTIISNSYKNRENIDLSKVPAYAKHEKDTGSSEYQVARLTARVAQLSSHLQKNKKDHAAKRGLQAILNQRKSILQYLYRKDRDSYDVIIKDFGIRSAVVRDVRGASREKSEVSP